MSGYVRLVNNGRQPLLFTLLHDSYCRSGTCTCTRTHFVASELDPTTGKVGYRPGLRLAPASVFVVPGAKSEPLHTDVVRVPGVDTAVAQGWVQVESVVELASLSDVPSDVPSDVVPLSLPEVEAT